MTTPTATPAPNADISLSDLDPNQIDRAIEIHSLLRERATRHLKDHPECLGTTAWLRSAISETDITLTLSADGTTLMGSGYTYTTQTCGSEPFDFEIPLSLLLR